ncbi:MAG: class C sortase [Roseburia sp.]|nr:class C sortase [Roseburia sp.]MCM1097918.1 class C sortase [Ruminococcus flavefaciens]
MARKITGVLFVLLFVVGLGILLYPTISDRWNAYRQSQLISNYEEAVAQLDPETHEEMWVQAQQYNAGLWLKANRYEMTDEERAEYEGCLNLEGNGIMGSIEIPKIKCTLPIYHGTEEDVLQIAVGHLEGTSLPVGGEGVHCVLSGHRGLPSAKLFTNLDQLEIGDTFLLKILGETLTYEIDQILTVLPEEMESLELFEGEDYCTLVTCTPYGVNSHRLLVRGKRVAE